MEFGMICALFFRGGQVRLKSIERQWLSQDHLYGRIQIT